MDEILIKYLKILIDRYLSRFCIGIFMDIGDWVHFRPSNKLLSLSILISAEIIERCRSHRVSRLVASTLKVRPLGRSSLAKVSV